MMVNGVSLWPPRKGACTVALYEDGTVQMGTWSHLANSVRRMTDYRQGRACLVEGGVVNPLILSSKSDSDDLPPAANDADVVYRSAMGASQDGRILFVGIGERQSVRALARGMAAAGAFAALQIEVTRAFARMLVYDWPRDSRAVPEPVPLFASLLYTKAKAPAMVSGIRATDRVPKPIGRSRYGVLWLRLPKPRGHLFESWAQPALRRSRSPNPHDQEPRKPHLQAGRLLGIPPCNRT